MSPELSVVIPAYNEEKRLSQSLDIITRYLQEQKPRSEIIVVSDGSVDQTVAVVRRHQGRGVPVRLLVNKSNRGKGAAIRRGVAAARGEWILFSDADLSTPIAELKKLEKAAQTGAEIMIASRAVRGADIIHRQPIYREFMGKTFNLLVQLLVLPGLHDTQCGFKLFRRAPARKIFARLTIPGFGFDAEVLFLARKFKVKISEVPVCWKNVLESKVSPLRHSAQMLMDLFRIRWRHRGKVV
ncbi:glycosyltransferase family 2 protein [candidate division FCPU426 bacterium]|nr:glycosyltransferase family 2 protein [candidate division FCPU426 bacterium]